MVAGESTYLRLLGLYGLVFPAYALLFMSPWARMTPNRLTLLLLGVLLLPCALALDLAFVGHRTGDRWPAGSCAGRADGDSKGSSRLSWPKRA